MYSRQTQTAISFNQKIDILHFPITTIVCKSIIVLIRAISSNLLLNCVYSNNLTNPVLARVKKNRNNK